MAKMLLTEPVIHPTVWNGLLVTSAQCQTLLSLGLPKTAEPAVNQAGFRVSQIFRIFYTCSFLSEHKQDFRCLRVVFAQYLALMLIIGFVSMCRTTRIPLALQMQK